MLLTFLCCFLSLELLRGSVQLQGNQECLCVLEILRLTFISVPAWFLVVLVVDRAQSQLQAVGGGERGDEGREDGERREEGEEEVKGRRDKGRGR